MKKQRSIRIEDSLVEEVSKLAKKTDRSNNYYYVKWIKEGLKREIKAK